MSARMNTDRKAKRILVVEQSTPKLLESLKTVLPKHRQKVEKELRKRGVALPAA